MRLLDVSEVSLCTYEAVATSPGACELHDADTEDSDILMPEEL